MPTFYLQRVVYAHSTTKTAAQTTITSTIKREEHTLKHLQSHTPWKMTIKCKRNAKKTQAKSEQKQQK